MKSMVRTFAMRVKMPANLRDVCAQYYACDEGAVECNSYTSTSGTSGLIY